MEWKDISKYKQGVKIPISQAHEARLGKLRLQLTKECVSWRFDCEPFFVCQFLGKDLGIAKMKAIAMLKQELIAYAEQIAEPDTKGASRS